MGVRVCENVLNDLVCLIYMWTACKSQGPGVQRPGGGLPYETDGNARRLAYGCKFWIWSRLGCSGQSANILTRQGLV